MTDINAESTLKNLIQKTQQALDEGWIHTQEFQDILDSVKGTISDKRSQDDSYPIRNGFHVLMQE